MDELEGILKIVMEYGFLGFFAVWSLVQNNKTMKALTMVNSRLVSAIEKLEIRIDSLCRKEGV